MTRTASLVLSLLAFTACTGYVSPRTSLTPTSEDSATMLAGSQRQSSLEDRNGTGNSAAEESLAQLESSVSDAAVADATAGPAAPEPVSWDIDVASYATEDRVEFYVDRFTGAARDRIVSWLKRGRQYEPMIRGTFRAAGIPEDMYYLGLVESGYDPQAYSRAAAVGMWQFMTSTAKGMGLRVDWWVDERRDPVKSTLAAARFLGGLRDQFGSLYLAAAAYNGGPGRISRSLSKFADDLESVDGDDRFFALAQKRGVLKAETSNYVPQLIAAALIGKDPSHYGIQLDSVAPFAYDSVVVPPATSIAVVAEAAGVPVDSVRFLNPQILRGVTPPSETTALRIPAGSSTRFDSAFALLPDSAREALHRVKPKKSTTMYALARSAGITTKQLAWYNPKLAKVKSGRVSAGSVVMVPTAGVVRAAFDVPDPSIERYGVSAGGVYVVRKGDSLWSIAHRFGTSVDKIVRLNHLKKQVIFPGQSIHVRG